LKLLYTLLLSTIFLPSALGQGTNLDQSFGIGGKAINAIAWEFQGLFSIELQSDGKIVVGGNSGAVNYMSHMTVARYFSNGAVDSSFGINGRVKFNPDSANGSAWTYSVAIQKLGPTGTEKIIAGGLHYGAPTWPDWSQVLLRYHPNGTRDMSFGTNGMIWEKGMCNKVRIQPDGKIVVAGGSSGLLDLHRYLPDGAPDSSFGINGYTSLPPSTVYSFAKALALLPDGRILVAGAPTNTSGFMIVRYKANGTKDSSFGLHGSVNYYVGPNAELNSVVVQPDGKIVAFGSADNAVGPTFVFLRYDSTGVRDNSFGNSGIVRLTYGNLVSHGKDMIVQPDGKLIAVGYTQPAGPAGYIATLVARLQDNGLPDSTFGTDGTDTLRMGTMPEAYAARLLPNGKLLVGGRCYGCKDPTYLYYFNEFLVRYLTGLDLGVINLQQDNTYVVYPNPVKETAILTYELAKEEELSIYLSDMSGRIVQDIANHSRRTAGKHKELLQLHASLPPGYYLLNISSHRGRYSVRIVKE
jgi:uncharacterized delta-60 repeat protein